MPHVVTPRRKKSGASPNDQAKTARKDGGKRRPGRPPIHDESWTKVTVVLFDRQIQLLDRLAANVRAKHGAAISRAQLIRALVDSVDPGSDAASLASSAELNQSILARLGVVRREG